MKVANGPRRAVVHNDLGMQPEKPSEYTKRPDARRYLKLLECLREWDPIGVISADNQDEYDHYAPPLIRLLDAGCSSGQLARELGSIRTQMMGMGGRPTTIEKHIAVQLVEYWKLT